MKVPTNFLEMPNIKFYNNFHSLNGVVKLGKKDRQAHGYLWCSRYPLVESVLCRQ